MTVDQKAQVANAREEKPMSSRNDEQNSAEGDLRTPDVWCVELGVQVLDADGWRGRDGRDWTDPISQAEFQERLATCTQRSTAPRDQHQKWADPQGLIVDTQPAGEQHTGTLNLTGDGNAPEHDGETCPHPDGPCTHDLVMPGVTGATLTLAVEAFAGLPRSTGDYGVAQTILEAAAPAIRQQVAEEIAAAIAVSRSRITPGRPGWDYLSEAIDITKRVGGVA